MRKIVQGLFLGGSLFARAIGRWETGLSMKEYAFHIANLEMPLYKHHRGQVPKINTEAWLKMMQEIETRRNRP